MINLIGSHHHLGSGAWLRAGDIEMKKNLEKDFWLNVS